MGARLASQIREFKITSYSMWKRHSPRLISLLIRKLCLFVCFFTQELINTLLCVDQSKRITATEALKHPWIVVCLCTNVSLVFRLFQRIRQSFCLCFEF